LNLPTPSHDFLYAFEASRDYDPSAKLAQIQASVTLVNFADDFINPPEPGIAKREIKKAKKGKYVLVPASDEDHAHSTQTMPALWQQYLK